MATTDYGAEWTADPPEKVSTNKNNKAGRNVVAGMKKKRAARIQQRLARRAELINGEDAQADLLGLGKPGLMIRTSPSPSTPLSTQRLTPFVSVGA